MSNLVEHAQRELTLAHVADDLYGQMLPDAVLELVAVFAAQGHSGMSAAVTIDLFSKVAAFKNLSPLTNNEDEWFYHEPDIAGKPGGLWQNKRNPEAFSQDAGNTYYLLSEMNSGTIHTSAKAGE